MWLVASMISIVCGVFNQILRAFTLGIENTILIQLISLIISIYWWICIRELNEVFIRENVSQIKFTQPRGGEKKHAHGQMV